MRGVIEISNHCRKNCDYCAMRYSNKQLKRYRLTTKEIFSRPDSLVISDAFVGAVSGWRIFGAAAF